MSIIRFEVTPLKLGDRLILRLPESASAALPSRGSTLVEGTVNGCQAKIVLEPDGKGSHWFELDANLREAAGIEAGDPVTVAVEPSKDWPEPEAPVDLNEALACDPQARELWEKITPMARWDWIRWVRATHNPETRSKRIEVAMSKMRAGERRPCCFNRNQCTDPEVSKGGILIEPTLSIE